MVRLLGLSIGESDQSPREITRRRSSTQRNDTVGENGWLMRFFDSAFFCEWIAVSYLYKHEHPGVRDYLCNRMYTLPLSGVERYLFQICYMMLHKPSPSLDRFVIDICSKSLKIALKVHWFLMAEIEDSEDDEGISRIQESCENAAMLMGEWSPLISPYGEFTVFGSKNQVLNNAMSSKQRFMSLTSSPSTQLSYSLTPTQASASDENSLFKKFVPVPKVRDALRFRNSTGKEDDDESDKDGFFKRLLRERKYEDGELTSSIDGFFKRILRDSTSNSLEQSVPQSTGGYEKEGFFRKLLKERFEDRRVLNERNEEGDKRGSGKRVEYEEKEGFFRKFFKYKVEERKDTNERPDAGDEAGSPEKSVDNVEKEGFLRNLLKEKFEVKKDGNEKNENEEKVGSQPFEEDDNDGFFRKLFKEKKYENEAGAGHEKYEDDDDVKEGFFCKFMKEVFEDRNGGNNGTDGGNNSREEEQLSDFSLFRKLLRVHPVEVKAAPAGRNVLESSPATENFFLKLFRDRDRSVEDSELFDSKQPRERLPGSPKQRNEKSNPKPPLHNNLELQFRRGAYRESLYFIQSLCDTSYGLIDVFPVEDRKSALRESLEEINSRVAEAQNSGGVCFPMGRGMFRVLNILANEAVLLNSREKAPYLICLEVLRCETPSNIKDPPNNQKLSRGGIPLANVNAFLPRPPPWACPLSSIHGNYYSNDRMSRSTSQAIDQAMGQFREANVKFVNVTLQVEEQYYDQSYHSESKIFEVEHDLELVRVVLTVDPRLSLDDIEDLEPPWRKEHRRVPSTIAIEEVKAAAAKGEAPPGLPLKGAGQDPTVVQTKIDLPKPTDALSGELWMEKKERIQKASIHGKLPGWDLCSVIVKSGDDCRQEHMAVQLISHFYDIFQEAGLPLWLCPYEVLVTSPSTALIETIPDTASIHSIKSRNPYIASLREFFNAKYQENPSSLKIAQRNFVESMAGYSLVCYLLQVKDRHNGNLLLDEGGHIIHIDFGFMLSNSPGGVNFESAPFKLTRELLEVMDSGAEGLPSEFFDYFKVLCIQGFLTCRKHAERIILLVEMLQNSGFPCFKGGPRTIQNLRKRFHLSLTEEQCVSLVLSLISSSLDAWRTRQYDYYQRVLNGIL